MTRIKIIFGCFIFLCATKLCAQTMLVQYIDSALKNNPELQTYQFKSEALQQEIKPSEALDDPEIYAGVMNLPTNFSFTQDMMTMKQIGIQQKFNIAKKYTLRGKVAQKSYEASTYDVETQKLFLIKEVKQTYYELYSESKAIEVTKKNISVLKSYISIANTKYSTGEGTQQDVLKAQVELSKMQEELIETESMKEHTIAVFNTLLARNIMDSVQVIPEIKFQKINLPMYPLMDAANANNPMVISSKIKLNEDSAAFALAKTSKIPDFTTGLWYGQRQAIMTDGNKAPDMIGFTIGMTLPIFSKQKQNPLIAESAINIQKSQSEVAATQNQVKLMLHHVLIDAYKNEKLVSLYSGQLIPEATENLNAGITGYQENKIDFMTLTDNFISLYNYQLQYYQAIADYYKAIAEIEMLTGKKLINQ